LGAVYLSEKVRFSDLVIQSMDRSGLTSDPTNFNMSGTLTVAVANIGRYSTDSRFILTAYYDSDLSGTYDSSVDQYLGGYLVEKLLIEDEVVSVEFEINAQLPFRDAPIRVSVDTNSEVPEMLEDNNDGSTCELAGCGG
jgi:hypothetical protein